VHLSARIAVGALEIVFPRIRIVGQIVLDALVPDGTRRSGLEAQRSAVPGRSLEGLDQGEEQDAPGDGAGDGVIPVNRVGRRARRPLSPQ
jgi:hypothetical protein